jgi:hypothetical protein
MCSIGTNHQALCNLHRVTHFSAGSLREFAAAFNRAPELFNNRLEALYRSRKISIRQDLLKNNDSQNN